MHADCSSHSSMTKHHVALLLAYHVVLLIVDIPGMHCIMLALLRDFMHNALQRYFTKKKIRFIAQRVGFRADLCKALCETSMHRQNAMSFLFVLMVNETAIVVQRTACPVSAIPPTVLYGFFFEILQVLFFMVCKYAHGLC